ncbi:MAG: hypothetical protein GF411_19840 [Candidatus Lokiarchaeota archaeon]|nr:hypothetical protein [Candidatus Lokiarchaeota archaeon]
MTEVTFTCPICSSEFKTEIDDDMIREGKTNPVPIVIPHGDPEHAVTVFIDKEYRLRGVNPLQFVHRFEEVKLESRDYFKSYIPFPLEEEVSFKGLDNKFITILNVADGHKTVEDIAEIIDESPFTTRMISLLLVRMGKLDSLRTVMRS